MSEPDPTVMQAIATVRSRYGLDEWLSLTPQQITEKIYSEVRRLDLIRVQAMLSGPATEQYRIEVAAAPVHAEATL